MARKVRKQSREELTEQISVRFTKRAMARLRARAARLRDTPCGHIRACVEAVDSREVRPAVVIVQGERGRPAAVPLVVTVDLSDDTEE